MKCDESVLKALVEQSVEPGEESDRIFLHVQSCGTCQRTLEQLSGQEHDWDEARHWISQIDDDEARQSVSQKPSLDLGFLDEAKHPEMLGRIGRYDIEAVLGRGGMGVVFRAHDSNLHRSVAVKVLLPTWAASDRARERFAREAQAAASVAHENVIPIYNVEADGDLPYLVMQYVPGGTLEQWAKKSQPIDVATILRIAAQLAEGLAAAHRRGLIHRDIKPANVMVGENTDRVWITDFGLARAADQMTLTQTGVIAGTPHYMSPEQARGEAIDQRSDIFSLGCVFYFLATGKPPLDAENTLAVLQRIIHDRPEPLPRLRDDLPPSFVSLVDQMLSVSPSDRPSNCDRIGIQLIQAAEELAEGKTARHKEPHLRQTFWLVPIALILVGLASMAFLNSLNSLGQPSVSKKTLEIDNEVADAAPDPYVITAADQIVQQSHGLLAMEKWNPQFAAIANGIERLTQPDSATLPQKNLFDHGHDAWQQRVGLLRGQIENQRSFQSAISVLELSK